jgi:hypothetical protein
MDASESESPEFCLLGTGLEVGIAVYLVSLDNVLVQLCSFAREVVSIFEFGDSDGMSVMVG